MNPLQVRFAMRYTIAEWLRWGGNEEARSQPLQSQRPQVLPQVWSQVLPQMLTQVA